MEVFSGYFMAIKLYLIISVLLPLLFWFKHIYFKNNIHGNYNIVIYVNIIGSERKHYSLFGSSPKHVK